jgi:hypothetical protein
MIRFRALAIAAGNPDANDCDTLRRDPAFKLAVGRLPETGADLCSLPTMTRLENLPGPVALKRMMASMVEPFCDSFGAVPRRIVKTLTIDQTLALMTAHPDTWELVLEVPVELRVELWNRGLVVETPLGCWKMTPLGYELWRMLRED